MVWRSDGRKVDGLEVGRSGGLKVEWSEGLWSGGRWWDGLEVWRSDGRKVWRSEA